MNEWKEKGKISEYIDKIWKWNLKNYNSNIVKY